MKKNLLIIALLPFLFFGMASHAMEQSFLELPKVEEKGKGKLRIVNNSNWEVTVTYSVEGRQLRRNLTSKGGEFIAGDINRVQSLSIKTYGVLYAIGAKETQIDLSSVRSRPNDDVSIEITVGSALQFYPWIFTPIWAVHVQLQLPGTGDPYDAFPRARKARLEKASVYPRYILSVPEDATRDDVKAAYKDLSLRWHPDKHRGNQELATEIFKIVKNAYDMLIAYHDALDIIKKLENKLSKVETLFKEKEPRVPETGPVTPAVIADDIHKIHNTIKYVKSEISKYEQFTKEIESEGKKFTIWDENRAKQYLAEWAQRNDLTQKIKTAEQIADEMIKYFERLQ